MPIPAPAFRMFPERLPTCVAACFCVALATVSTSSFALPFTTGRAGGGYTYLPGKSGSSASTYSYGGTARFGYMFDEVPYFLAIDVSAFRLNKASALKYEVDGNNALAVLGYNFATMSIWLAGGAGEMRIFDRPGDKGRPYRYYNIEEQFGYSYQLYSADYAKVEIGCILSHFQPDKDFQAKTNLKSAESLQFNVGFKLLNW